MPAVASGGDYGGTYAWAESANRKPRDDRALGRRIGDLRSDDRGRFLFVSAVRTIAPVPFEFSVGGLPPPSFMPPICRNHRQHLPMSRGQKGHSMDDAHTKLTWWQLALLLSAVLG